MGMFTTESGYTFRKDEDYTWRCGNIISVTEYQDGTFLSTIRATHYDGILSYPKTIPSGKGYTLEEVAELACRFYELQNDLENETRRISGELAKIERALKNGVTFTFGDCVFERHQVGYFAEVDRYKVKVSPKPVDGKHKVIIYCEGDVCLQMGVVAENEKDAMHVATGLLDVIREASGEVSA